MQEFLDEIEDIQNIDLLILFKEHIKTQIMEPQIHWKTRMFLYKKVQIINSKIQLMI